MMDRIHAMGDPVGAAGDVRRAIKNDRSWMIVETFANDDLEDNMNPVDRVYYSFHTGTRSNSRSSFVPQRVYTTMSTTATHSARSEWRVMNSL